MPKPRVLAPKTFVASGPREERLHSSVVFGPFEWITGRGRFPGSANEIIFYLPGEDRKKHLVDFRHSKKSDEPEWLIETKSKSDLTKEWTKSFTGRIARFHAENQIDEAADWGAD
ncbi:hypothetical protein BV898_08606 [Hypsibius exemplaris]|uniref:Uncharacterized protein n=1 Tax=Hypsibius exemplaris TaxID=2072580 RepID=A0A1W0WQD5_HYPEX|nr:hypothetical protein BV898_08606 [Hypsibius exemplaris]